MLRPRRAREAKAREAARARRIGQLRAIADGQREQAAAEREHLTSVLLHQAETLAMVRRDVQQIRAMCAAAAGAVGTMETTLGGMSQRVTDLATACHFMEIRPPAGVTGSDRSVEFP